MGRVSDVWIRPPVWRIREIETSLRIQEKQNSAEKRLMCCCISFFFLNFYLYLFFLLSFFLLLTLSFWLWNNLFLFIGDGLYVAGVAYVLVNLAIGSVRLSETLRHFLHWMCSMTGEPTSHSCRSALLCIFKHTQHEFSALFWPPTLSPAPLVSLGAPTHSTIVWLEPYALFL